MLKTPATSYVCGFARIFSNTGREAVLLLEKNQPAWQRGLLNGVGGKIEPSDVSPLAAMHREWCEETGIKVDLEWRAFCTAYYPKAVVHFFETDVPTVFEELHGERNDVGERFVLTPYLEAVTSAKTIPNLKWLLPLAFRDEDNLTTVAVELPRPDAPLCRPGKYQVPANDESPSQEMVNWLHRNSETWDGDEGGVTLYHADGTVEHAEPGDWVVCGADGVYRAEKGE